MEVDKAWINAAEKAADQAGAIIRRYFRARIGIETKHDLSPVTIADREAEAILRAVLRHHCPDHGLIGEEMPPDNPDARHVWLIDPIDGTRAFITGRPSFCILIALLDQGVPVIGVIDQPVTGERWIGASGHSMRFHGPFGGTPGTRCAVSLSDAELSCTSPDMHRPEHTQRFHSLATAVRRTSWGGDAYTYGLLALGLIDVIAESSMKPWDWAALVPVIEAAGGRVTDWQGQLLTQDSDGTVLALGNPALLQDAVAALRWKQ
jgi:inositol-phosphate phosphatase/L-galactose 1-phosphate phosphatase/histidinol-phosphatase